MIEMEVEGITLDSKSNMPIVILKSKNKKMTLPIWIGFFEASAIALELQEVTTPRPLTHDLLRTVIRKLNAEVVGIRIDDLKNNTFYAKIMVKNKEEEINIDSRPSDAIALALRTNSPIFVAEHIITDMENLDQIKGKEEDLKSFLESLQKEDFGKYKM